MAPSGLTPNESDIVVRMNAIRNASEQHVAQLHHEVERLKDWREHVRAQPILAVAASAFAGYVVVSKLTKPRSATQRSEKNGQNTEAKVSESTASEVATTTSISAGAMAFVGSLASSALRMAATNYVRSMLDKRMNQQ